MCVRVCVFVRMSAFPSVQSVFSFGLYLTVAAGKRKKKELQRILLPYYKLRERPLVSVFREHCGVNPHIKHDNGMQYDAFSSFVERNTAATVKKMFTVRGVVICLRILPVCSSLY